MWDKFRVDSEESALIASAIDRLRRPTLSQGCEALRAAEKMDWVQVVLNGGPPCFHVDADDGRFCGRAERWEGHDDMHRFVSLSDLLRMLSPCA